MFRDKKKPIGFVKWNVTTNLNVGTDKASTTGTVTITKPTFTQSDGTTNSADDKLMNRILSEGRWLAKDPVGVTIKTDGQFKDWAPNPPPPPKP